METVFSNTFAQQRCQARVVTDSLSLRRCMAKPSVVFPVLPLLPPTDLIKHGGLTCFALLLNELTTACFCVGLGGWDSRWHLPSVFHRRRTRL